MMLTLLFTTVALASPTLPAIGPLSFVTGAACVVPGGTCDATTTCCGEGNNCLEGTCKPFPRGEEGGDVSPGEGKDPAEERQGANLACRENLLAVR